MNIGYLMQEGAADLIKDPFAGPSVHVREVCRELECLGHRVKLIARIGRQIWKSCDLRTFAPVHVPLFDRGPIRLFEKGVRRTQRELRVPYAAMFDSLRFAAACRQHLEGCGLLYERWGWMGFGGALAARWLGVPLVLEVNGELLTELELRGMPLRGAQRWVSLVLTTRMVRAASHVVAAGEALRRSFIDSWGVNPGKVSVIENGSALVHLLQRDALSSFRQESADAVTTIVFVGSFDPWQGTTVLIRAVARAISDGISLRLLFIGSGQGTASARQLVYDLHLNDYITFAGQLAPQQYAPYLAAADIGISTYCGRTEYSGLKLFDYKAAGLGIIASGEYGRPRIIEHGQTGWIVPPCDVEALREAIVYLVRNAGLRKRMGRAARIEAEKLHGWDRTASRLSELFDQVQCEWDRKRAGAAIRTTS